MGVDKRVIIIKDKAINNQIIVIETLPKILILPNVLYRATIKIIPTKIKTK